jgi:hypothetical protein
VAIIYVDIDETICKSPNTRDYNKARPIKTAIDKVNSYYDRGDTIVYWTARGTGSGIDWTSVTISQFKRWGVKYHELKFGKPIFDLFIDDRAQNANILLDD